MLIIALVKTNFVATYHLLSLTDTSIPLLCPSSRNDTWLVAQENFSVQQLYNRISADN